MLTRILKSEDGAITVDWVVLTAALVTLAITVLIAVTSGATDLADNISGAVGSMTVSTY
jgi:hypothetical protein